MYGVQTDTTQNKIMFIMISKIEAYIYIRNI